MTIRSQRSKITLKDMGNPSMIKGMSAEQLAPTKGRLVLGYLLGKASSFVERTQPNTAEKFEGLSGAFALMPADPEAEELESGVLFIPDAFHNLIAVKLRELQKTDPAAECEFVFEVAAIKAGNPQGYSWDFKPAKEFAGAHPLENLFADVKKIADMRKAPSQLEAPGRTAARK
jgi:hypothetical protein